MNAIELEALMGLTIAAERVLYANSLGIHLSHAEWRRFNDRVEDARAVLRDPAPHERRP